MKKLLFLSFFYCSLFSFAQNHTSITSPSWNITKINNIEVPNGWEHAFANFSTTLLEHQFLNTFEGPISFSSWENKFVKTGEMVFTTYVDIPGVPDAVYQIQYQIDSFYYNAPVGTEYYYEVSYNGIYHAFLKVTKNDEWEQVEAFYTAQILSDENATKKNLQIAFDRTNKNVRINSPEEISEVRIFDMSGKEVRKKTTANGTKQTSVSTVGLPKGAYFAMVNLKYSQKFLVE